MSLLAQLVASQTGSSLLPRIAASRTMELALGASCTRLRHIATSSPWLMSTAQPQQQDTPPQQPQQAEETASSSGQAQETPQGAPSAEDVQQRVASAFRAGYDTVRSSLGVGAGGSGGSNGGASSSGSNGKGTGSSPHSVLSMLAREVGDVFRPADNIRSATRKYTGPVMDIASGDSTATALQVVRRQQTAWERLQDKLFDLPGFSKLRSFRVTDTSAYKKGQEVVEDLKEKYETSDHPMVHKVDEVKEKLMSGSESSQAMRELRTRDPSFDLNTFVRSIKLDAPVVVRALLTRDLDTLSLHVGPEMMERLAGIFKHEAERGIEDPTILFTSDVEIVEVRLMDGDPFVVAQFNCQQLKCVRDKFGNVVEGSPDAIQRVYYFWGLQQEKESVVTADGTVLPPRWVIRDMMWQSMLALV